MKSHNHRIYEQDKKESEGKDEGTDDFRNLLICLPVYLPFVHAVEFGHLGGKLFYASGYTRHFDVAERWSVRGCEYER